MQAPSPFRLPVLGSQLTDGRRYPRQMPKSGKRQPDKKSDPLPVVAILQKSLRALFKYAKDIPALHNRRNSVALQNWMREQPQWGDSVSKSHINRIENGEGPVGIDVVDMIARAFGYDAWELLHPSFEPRSEAERQLWRDFQTFQQRRSTTPGTTHGETADAGGADVHHDPARAAGREISGARSPRPASKPAPAKKKGKATKARV
jgi:hypothetical protein